MLAGVLRRMRCVSLLEVNGGGFLKACRSTSGSTYRNYFIKLNQNTIHHPIPGYQCVGCVCVFIEGCVGEALCFGRSRWSICLSFCHSDVFLYTIPCFIFVATLYIKIKDIRPSMVTHTLNSCSSINPSKVHTHSSEHTHTVNTQPEQWAAIYTAVPREQLGVRCLAQGHLSHGIEGGESIVHSLPPPTIPAGPRFELATLYLRVWLSNH